MSSFDFSLSGSEVTSDISYHSDNMVDIVTSLKLELDGINKSGSKFGFFEFSKYIWFNSIGAYEGNS